MKSHIKLGKDLGRRPSKFSNGDVEMIDRIPWLKELTEQKNKLSLNHWKLLGRKTLEGENIDLVYSRYRTILEMREEIDRHYKEHILFKIDFLNNNLELGPEHFDMIIKSFQNNFRNTEFMDELITYSYSIDADEGGYWHMHMFFFLKTDRLRRIPDSILRYQFFNDFISVPYFFFEGVLKRLGLHDSVRLNISDRVPDRLKNSYVIVISNSHVKSFDTDVYWLSYICKRSEATDDWYKGNGKIRLFGRGKIRLPTDRAA